ncbi:MAG: J domain-containing protein [Pseudomonadota bacterium]
MSSAHDIDNYYELLELDANASWDDLRKSFKRKAQQHHPDRYQPGSAEHDQATLTFKTITQAFRVFEEYFKIHGQLPPRLKHRSQSDILNVTTAPPTSSETNFAFRSTVRQQKFSHSRNRRTRDGEMRKGFRYFLWFLISMLIAAYLIVENPPTAKAPTESMQGSFQSSGIYGVRDANLTYDSHKVSTQKKRFLQASSLSSGKNFTFGSSLSEVMHIHGSPDRTQGSRVYFQKSWIELENDQVTNWHADPTFPLATSLK